MIAPSSAWSTGTATTGAPQRDQTRVRLAPASMAQNDSSQNETNTTDSGNGQ